nr:hypothetical protein [Tanacetum cinerariifolium]
MLRKIEKSYDLDNTIFSTMTSKDAKPTKVPKAKESQSGSSKGNKTQSKSFGKSVQLEEPEFEVADSDLPQDQEENPSNDDEEPTEKMFKESLEDTILAKESSLPQSSYKAATTLTEFELNKIVIYKIDKR